MTDLDTVSALLSSWLGAPFLEGGRDRDGIDCLGITRVAVEALGLPAPDPWPELCGAWRRGSARDALIASGFPDGWRRVEVPLVAPDGLVAILPTVHGRRGDLGHVGAVVQGVFWSARSGSGVYAEPWFRVRERVSQAWRFEA